MTTRAERQTQAAQRRTQVLQARLTGATFEDIGRQLGISTTRAYQLYTDALQRTVKEPADRLRTLELQRLDQLQAAAVAVLRSRHVVIQGGRPVVDRQGRPYPDHGPVLGAITALLRISESRRKLLGLDAPAKVDAQLRAEVYSIAAIDEELARVQAELDALGPPDPPAAEQLRPAAPVAPAPAPAPVVDVGGLVAQVLERALDAARVPEDRRSAAYTAAARHLQDHEQEPGR
jgi:hypothetical protein